MKKRSLLLFLLMICSTGYELMACSCAGIQPFCNYAQELDENALICIIQPTGNCDSVLLDMNICQYEVIEVLYGTIHEGDENWVNTNETIWILGGASSLCLGANSPYTTRQYLLAAYAEKTFEGITAYSTSICREDYIDISDEEVTGYFYGERPDPEVYVEQDVDIVSWSVFRAELSDCIGKDIANGLENNSINHNYHCYPNPVNTTLYIDYLNTSMKDTPLALYDVNGQQVWSGLANNNSTIEVATDDLADGVYYLVEGGAKGRFVEKVLVVGD